MVWFMIPAINFIFTSTVGVSFSHQQWVFTQFVTLFCSTMYDQPIGEITEGTVAVGRRPCERRRSPDHNAPIYGELLVLG